MLRSCLTVAATALYAATLRAQASGGERHAEFNVPAAASTWLASGIVVEKGDRIDVKATGMISVSRFSFSVDANGISRFGWGERGSRYLEYRVGEGSPKPTGKAVALTADTSGELQFRVHDDDYSDNYGSFHIDVVVGGNGVTLQSAAPAPFGPNDAWKPDLDGVIAAMKYTLNNVMTVADESMATKGYYGNPFLDPRVTLPPGISTNGFTQDGKGYSVIVKHFAKPKARCAVAYRLPNPLEPGIGDRNIACEWRNFDPPWGADP